MHVLIVGKPLKEGFFMISETVDLPLPIPPVIPITFITLPT